jgi:putative ABC transport system substrate-binding protein
MACEILTNGADVSTMEVQYAPKFTKEYNATICKALGITPPSRLYRHRRLGLITA